MPFPPVASRSSESFSPPHTLAGDKAITTQGAVALSGQTFVYLQVLGRVTASKKLVAHDPAATNGSEVAVALAAYPVDASAADTPCQVITAGEFAMQALTFNAATNTDALKLAVFPIGSPIIVKKLAYGAA